MVQLKIGGSMEAPGANIFYSNTTKIISGFYHTLPNSGLEESDTKITRTKVATVVMSRDHFLAFAKVLEEQKIKIQAEIKSAK
jgi:hypothetical protein